MSQRNSELEAGGAVFSSCRRYRYSLSRDLPAGSWSTPSRCLFVMLNPSTADESKLDPTVRRCVSYAIAWGHTALDVANIFALRSTDPRALYSEPDPVGPENDAWIERLASKASRVVCAWGSHGALHHRGDRVIELLTDAFGARLQALALTASGEPGHPLYLPKAAQPFAIASRDCE